MVTRLPQSRSVSTGQPASEEDQSHPWGNMAHGLQKQVSDAMAGLLGVSLKQLASLSLDRLESSWDKWAPYTRELWQVYRELSKEAGGLPMLRLLSILPHNVGFLAICRVFPLLRNPAQLHDLVRLEREGLTARASGLWDGRCMTLGKITKSGDAVALTAAMLATQLGVELDDNLKLFL